MSLKYAGEVCVYPDLERCGSGIGMRFRPSEKGRSMELIRLHQLTGLAGILAGLGVLGSYGLTKERKERYPAASWWVYSGNNYLLVLALLGFYLWMVESAPNWGSLAFVVGLAGVIALAYPRPIAGIEAEQIGSLLLALAVALLTVGSLASGAFPIWVSGLWAAAFLFGLPGLVFTRLRTLGYVLGGIPYSLGFIAAGALLLRAG